ncbi:hypothetical protein AB0941_30685 [Streptomyces sp. NPDC013433]|uniref:hypothetical protein n=1 Tax=Streptomyces sp. NPDC013433 TaxID=3155604 RepID=UPI003451EEF2
MTTAEHPNARKTGPTPSRGIHVTPDPFIENPRVLSGPLRPGTRKASALSQVRATADAVGEPDPLTEPPA